MKAKKRRLGRVLTKGEFFEAAWIWSRDFPFDISSKLEDIVWDAACCACDCVGWGTMKKLDELDRWLLYSQYCLERAGIPAGDR